MKEHRPWGYYQVLSDETDCKVKKIVVHPGMRLSLQRHRYRDEHWYILSGEAIITIGSDTVHVKSGQSVDIPRGEFHRITNPETGPVAFIEVQTGDYFGEDDIERVEDDYGRV
ncbi:MAG TPA: phosphomannose isomerase type II C-terminal cupin domain [Syntrophales bacterium]|nr:phosphomannose isomerase type II C-terminal cupin domain [Syntrophales bacterium]